MPNYVKSGSELQVNSAGVSTQNFSRIASFAGGGYIIVWNTTDLAADGDGGAVKAQRFDSAGNKVGGEFLVNGSAVGTQTTPVVTTFADGSFAIAWATTDSLQDGSAGAIKARLFSASGTPLGAEFLVNTTTAGNQSAPSITTLANGNFLVSWDDAGTTDVYGRIFTAAGVPLGSDFRINTNLTGSQNFNDVVALAGGGFVAVWRTTDGLQDGSSDSVKGQIFDSNGTKVGGEFLVNTRTDGAQNDPSVTSLSGGGFVVAWVTSWNAEDGSSSAIKAQIFDASGARVGAEFLVNSAALSAQNEPVVTALPNNQFMIAWTTLDAAQDGNLNAVKAQVFDSTGARIGAEFLVNTQATGNQSVADLATLADGSVVASWTDTYADGPANWGIRAQAFAPAAPPPPVNQSPVITSDGQGATAIVNVAENGSAVTTVTSIDPEGQAVTYSIVGGADAARFTIGSLSGQLSFVASPNYEAPADANGDNVYEVIVQASDGSLFDTQAISVVVGNVNEPIAFTSSNNIITPENYAGPYQVSAFEPDNMAAVITYSIAGGADAALFSIDSATGRVSFRSAPDFEAPTDSGHDNVYDLVVSATDGNSASTQAITFRVYDSDEAPVIGSNGGGANASISVAENQSAVTIVSAADPENQAVVYAVAGGADAARFAIDSATGALSFVAAPNFEAPGDAGGDNVYNVIVSASAGGKTDTQALAVTVVNANEGLAITSSGGGASATVSVGENATAVTVVAATDVDGTAPTYSIAGGADSALFAIDASTGALRFLSAPNFEAPGDSGGDNVYDVVVAASDGSFTDTQAIAVTVGNVNEGVTITSAGAAFSLAEGNTAVTSIAAVDADGGPVSYAIAGGADASLFAIDSATGALSFVSARDFETPGDAGGDNVYDVIVSASDGVFTDSRALSVSVTNVNEPLFITSNGGGTSAALSLPEGQSAVTIVQASDVDGDPVTYAIGGGADGALFAIDAATGALRFLAAPDYEAPADQWGSNFYTVVVTATDGQFTSFQSIQILVGNVNEGLSITSGQTFSIVENGTAVTTVTAADVDGDSLTYSIAGGADASRFAIDSATGALRFVSAPNFEAPTDSGGNNVYDVIVSATDGSFADSKALSVTVTNANDVAPVIAFYPDSVTWNIPENLTYLLTISAADPEGGAISYSLTGADAALFSIDAATGALSWVSPQDFETWVTNGFHPYHVTIVASDGLLTDTLAATITITNVNESLAIVSGGGGASSSVLVVENDLAVTTVMAVDEDRTAPAYSIAGGADAARFTIDSATGALRFVAAPNFEAPGDAGGDNVYDVIVKASDGSFSDTQAISVIVVNRNEGPSITSGNLTASENGLGAGSVAASDPDGNALSYAIAGGADAARFTIDAATGALSFVSAPDFEAPADSNHDNVYDLIVSASDGSLSDSRAVMVTVGNVNESVTITSGGGGETASVSVGENGRSAAQIFAVDADGGPVSYAIVGGADASRFAIDASTGALSFASAPDYEAPSDSNGDNVYDVIVAASDGLFSDSQALAVRVTNVNEGVTINSNGGGSSASLTIGENGTTVTNVAAVDADGTPVTYSIAGGTDASRFAIDAATGLLRFLVAPNYEAPADGDGNNVYDVIVSASDGVFTDTQTLAIAISNVNEAVTINSNGGGDSAALSVAENNLAVATVSAADPDGGALTYAIAGGADAARFTIDAVTGALRFVAAPNFEAPSDAGGNNVYDVIVSASDGVFTDTQALAVAISNVNEAVTILSNGGGDSASLSVAENSLAVATVSAADADGGAVTYAIAGGADAARFTIDSVTGALRFVSAPNFEAPTDAGGNNVYDVIVSASDGSFTDTQALAVSVTNVREGNTITGNSANNTISTSSTVTGQPKASEGEDTIYGLGGADTISGAGGGDYIDGGDGADSITGGLGADWLIGGAGADKFLYNSTSESTTSAWDVIADFSRADGDKISLTAIDANVNAGGNQNFTFIGTSAFSGVAGQLRFEIIDGHTFISADVNGDRVADLQIELNGSVPLIATDFLL